MRSLTISSKKGRDRLKGVQPVWHPLYGIVLSRSVVGRGGYSCLSALHAVIVIFLVVMPVIIGGFGNLIVPFSLGCADIMLDSGSAVLNTHPR